MAREAVAVVVLLILLALITITVAFRHRERTQWSVVIDSAEPGFYQITWEEPATNRFGPKVCFPSACDWCAEDILLDGSAKPRCAWDECAAGGRSILRSSHQA